PVAWTDLPWGSAYYQEHGRMMPPDAVEQVRAFDAVLLGAVGTPGVPDHVTLWGLLLELRQRLDLWANVRPVRLLAGVRHPLAGRGPPDVDMLFVRENTEGEYSGVGGRAHAGLPHEVALDTSVFTRAGVERAARYAFELAEQRRCLVTSATKSNASRHGYVLWDEVVREVAADFPHVRLENVLVDALAARMVLQPRSLDVVVASNLFGDILTDIGAALQGGMGMAASANIAPGASVPGIFEPVHGSAPDIVGRGIANPIGAIWGSALMLEHLGQVEPSRSIIEAIAATCASGPKTPDIGGSATTAEVGSAIAERVRRG
ncbi:MAG: tartrate dehydrogenase/decarboxylase / D-malate dehydrogenase, partial [Gaiellales bacterium]|nr:tartrate dehydrogenase/decarboxylase / D-malate dehydrogenase [Gaiellales bacterium]